MSIETASQIILAVLAVLYSIVLVYEFMRPSRRKDLRAVPPSGVASRGGRSLPLFPP